MVYRQPGQASRFKGFEVGVELIFLRAVVLQWLGHQRPAARVVPVFGGADFNAQAAAGAILRRHLNRVAQAFKLGLESLGQPTKVGGCAVELRRCENLGTDCSVRTDHRAAVALHAQVRLPNRNVEGNGALFQAAGTRGPGAIGWECAHWQFVTPAFQQQASDAPGKVWRIVGNRWAPRAGGRDGLRHRNLNQCAKRALQRCEVAPQHFGTAPTPGLPQGFAHVAHGLLNGQHPAQREKAQLHHGADVPPQARFFSLRAGVDGVQPAPAIDQLLLRLARQQIPHLRSRNCRVQQNRRARCCAIEHIAPFQKLTGMDGHKLGLRDAPGRADGPWAESQIRHCRRTRLA